MNIHQKFHEMFLTLSKKDKSKCDRILKRLKLDLDILDKNYSEHLFELYRGFYIQKIFIEMYNFENSDIVTFLTNKCVASLREIKRKQKK